MQSTESAIISSCNHIQQAQTCGIIVLNVKCQTLDKNISNFMFYQLKFLAILKENFL